MEGDVIRVVIAYVTAGAGHRRSAEAIARAWGETIARRYPELCLIMVHVGGAAYPDLRGICSGCWVSRDEGGQSPS